MILIADSGGTKTHWIALTEGTSKPFHTSGLNPNVRSRAEILETMMEEMDDGFRMATRVFFFGAGLGTDAAKQSMREILKTCFPLASLEVDDDLTGAARGLCGNEAGGVGILGTGSNACFFDGSRVLRQRGGHGWIVGDEGSGADLGKSLLKSALDGQLPESLLQDLEKTAGMNLLEIRSRMYQGPQSSRFLGELAQVAVHNRSHPYIQRTLQDRFERYLALSKEAWGNGATVHFTGGIAHTFAFELQAACRQQELKVGRIESSPMPGLLRWVTDNMS